MKLHAAPAATKFPGMRLTYCHPCRRNGYISCSDQMTHNAPALGRCRVRLYENNKTEQKHSLSKDCNPRSMDVSKLHYSLLTSIAAGVVGYTISFLYVTLCSQAFAIAVFSVCYSKSNLKGFHGNRPFLCGWWWRWFTRFSSLFFELIIFTKMSRSICNLVHGGHFFLRNIGLAQTNIELWVEPSLIVDLGTNSSYSFLRNICGVNSFCPYFT